MTWNHRQYRVFGGLGRHEELPGSRSVLATTYWMDVTEFEQMRQTVELTRPVMAIVMIDNYEDLMKACPENKRSALLAALEEKLDRWTADTGGLLLGYDRDRYLFVFEERSFSNLCQHALFHPRQRPRGRRGRRRGRDALHRRGARGGEL